MLALRIPDVNTPFEFVLEVDLLFVVLIVQPHYTQFILVFLAEIRLHMLAQLEVGTLVVHRQDVVLLAGLRDFELHTAAGTGGRGMVAAVGRRRRRTAALVNFEEHEHFRA